MRWRLRTQCPEFERLDQRALLSGVSYVSDLSSSFNRIGIVSDGSRFSGGLDGWGNALSANLLGTSQTWNGTPFTIGAAGSSDVVSATGQTISLPAGQYASLQFLATAVNGNQANQPFTVKYSDGTTATFTQSISDWYTPQHYAGESTAVTMPYRDLFKGTKDSRTFYVYGYSFRLDATKTVSSITLPNDGNVELLSATLTTAPTPTPTLTTAPTPTPTYTVSVKDFGARGDGITNDTPAIQAALDSVPATGGTVYLPAGTYMITNSVFVRNNTALVGDGPTATIISSGSPNMICLEDVSNAAVKRMKFTSNVAISAWAYTGQTRTNLLFEDLTAEGTSSAFDAAFRTINLANSVFDGITYRRCQALYPNTNGFLVNGVGDNQNTWSKNVLFEDCKAIGAGMNARRAGSGDWTVGFDLVEGTNISGMVVQNCEASYSYQNGFHFEQAPQSLNVRLINCVANNNGQSRGATSPAYGWGYMLYNNDARHSYTLTGCTSSNNYKGDTNLGPLSNLQ